MGLKYRSLLHRSEYRSPWYHKWTVLNVSPSPNLLTKYSIRLRRICIWAVTKISSCLVNTTSRQGIKQLGNSFGSAFFHFPMKVAGENAWSPKVNDSPAVWCGYLLMEQWPRVCKFYCWVESVWLLLHKFWSHFGIFGVKYHNENSHFQTFQHAVLACIHYREGYTK